MELGNTNSIKWLDWLQLCVDNESKDFVF
jgi:hypothetical protein